MLDVARYVLDEWRNAYNHRRPHNGIGWQAHAAYAASLKDEEAGGVFSSAMLAGPPVGKRYYPRPRSSFRLALKSGAGQAQIPRAILAGKMPGVRALNIAATG